MNANFHRRFISELHFENERGPSLGGTVGMVSFDRFVSSSVPICAQEFAMFPTSLKPIVGEFLSQTLPRRTDRKIFIQACLNRFWICCPCKGPLKRSSVSYKRFDKMNIFLILLWWIQKFYIENNTFNKVMQWIGIAFCSWYLRRSVRLVVPNPILLIKEKFSSSRM